MFIYDKINISNVITRGLITKEKGRNVAPTLEQKTSEPTQPHWSFKITGQGGHHGHAVGRSYRRQDREETGGRRPSMRVCTRGSRF